jgi:hypothetical protein
MSIKKMLILVAVLIGTLLIFTACAAQPGPAGPQGPAGPAGPQGPAGDAAEVSAADLSCTECHNDTSLITGKKAAWETSLHGSGLAFIEEGPRNTCAGCHSGSVFSAMVAAGQNFSQIESVEADPTHQDCRTCHQIHTTYTSEDWALETDAPVAFVAENFADTTFDGGAGNLCANCHQARRVPYVAENGNVTIDTPRFNTHYGVEAQVLMGLGAIGVDGQPGAHYSMVENTCVGCHLGEGRVHTFEAQLTTCQECHADAENFDINGSQTEVQALIDELHELLVANGMIDEEGAVVQGTYPEDDAAALWNYNIFSHEDTSLGVHNPSYVKAALEWSIAALAE